MLWQCDGEPECPDGLDEWDQLCSEFYDHSNSNLHLEHYQRRKQDARMITIDVILMAPVSPAHGSVMTKMTVRMDLMK